MPDASPSSPAPHWPIGVVVFTAAYLSAAAAGVLLTGNREFVFYLVIMLALVAGIGAIHRRVGFSRGVLWALSLWGLSHMAGGLVPVPESWPADGGHRVDRARSHRGARGR